MPYNGRTRERGLLAQSPFQLPTEQQIPTLLGQVIVLQLCMSWQSPWVLGWGTWSAPMAQLELITPAQFDILNMDVDLPLRFSADLPCNYEENPTAAIEQLIARDRGALELAHRNQRQVVTEKICSIIIVALADKNPKACFERAMRRLGYPVREAAQTVKAFVYEHDPRLAPFMAGLFTAPQINGQADGNPEVRELLGESQRQAKIVDGRPQRKAVATIDLANLQERNATRHHSGDALELQVEQLLQWAGLSYQRSAPAPILKLFGERSEPDFTITEGIDDPSGVFVDGFYVECKNRPNPRVPDSDLVYGLMNVAMFYPKSTLVVLEIPPDARDRSRILNGVSAFMDHLRKAKRMGNLRAVVTLAQFRSLIQDGIGRAS